MPTRGGPKVQLRPRFTGHHISEEMQYAKSLRDPGCESRAQDGLAGLSLGNFRDEVVQSPLNPELDTHRKRDASGQSDGTSTLHVKALGNELTSPSIKGKPIHTDIFYERSGVMSNTKSIIAHHPP